MIVKSIRWKSGPSSFTRLLDYVYGGRSKGDEVFYHNTIFGDYSGIKSALEENDKYLSPLPNIKRVRLYHEVMRWHSEDAKHITKAMLEDFAREYIRLRAKDSIAIAVVHAKPEPHIHFVISGSELGSKELSRMDNKKFYSVKREIEEYQKNYPQITKSFVYQNYDRKKLKKGTYAKLEKKYQMSKREAKKQEVINLVQKCFKSAYTEDQFYDMLLELAVELQRRKNGKITSVKHKNIAYRFDKLGIDIEDLRRQEEKLTKSQLELIALKQKNKKIGKGRHRSLN